jgi:polar amino acid transport system substrate-binding protein
MGSSENDARRELLPTGRLRIGLNGANRLSREVGAEIACELAARLGVEASFVEYPTPGDLTDAAATEWDIAFVAADPDRMAVMAFTTPYAELEATYLVRDDSPIRTVADVDRVGQTIATPATAAYTLVLKRGIKAANLAFLAAEPALQQLRSGAVDAVAGLRDNLQRISASLEAVRVLTDSITRTQQAIAVPKAHAAALAYVSAHLSELRRSGFIAESVRKVGIIGASVPA